MTKVVSLATVMRGLPLGSCCPVAAVGPATDDAVPYDEPDYSGRVVVVLGSEGRGLRPRVRAACDQLIALPMRGKVESLNVGSAASAIVYGILQFRRRSVDRGP